VVVRIASDKVSFERRFSQCKTGFLLLLGGSTLLGISGAVLWLTGRPFWGNEDQMLWLVVFVLGALCTAAGLGFFALKTFFTVSIRNKSLLSGVRLGPLSFGRRLGPLSFLRFVKLGKDPADPRKWKASIVLRGGREFVLSESPGGWQIAYEAQQASALLRLPLYEVGFDGRVVRPPEAIDLPLAERRRRGEVEIRPPGEPPPESELRIEKKPESLVINLPYRLFNREEALRRTAAAASVPLVTITVFPPLTPLSGLVQSLVELFLRGLNAVAPLFVQQSVVLKQRRVDVVNRFGPITFRRWSLPRESVWDAFIAWPQVRRDRSYVALTSKFGVLRLGRGLRDADKQYLESFLRCALSI